ncbi:MAG: Mpo1-like protein [Ottowia sp.]|uniref:Mpo1 family 2-hydroxy fatty acid dioxygenase n=1 Tax=Ottowia sp. TaxID=1898956 RepID=UPI003C7911B6
MKTIVDQLAKYAEYHRDRRNIATHFIGIPMIVLAVQVLLARPVLMQGAIPITAALIISVLAAIYYLRLDRPLGLLMTVLLAIGLWMAQAAAGQSTATWLWMGIGLFVVGWVIQFVGHIYEGRKPAFVDDVIGLIIGPLFVAAELVFLLGLRRDLQHAIEERAGPTRASRIHAAS